MKDYGFFAYVNRMKFINRWGLMRNTSSENIQEHSHQVAVIAHLLGVIKVTLFNEEGMEIDPDRVATKALYHDCSEIFTGDLPTPVKYANEKIISAYKEIESKSLENLLGQLPEELRDGMREYVCMKEANEEGITDVERYEARLVKAADKLSAYIKCLDESKAGNDEYQQAEISIRNAIDRYEMDEVDYFVEKLLPAVTFSLDELMQEC